MATTKEDVVEYLKGITLLEASELVKELEEVFGVSAAAAAAPMMMAAPAGDGGAAAAEEKKMRKYSDIISGVDFAPVAIETSGAWGQTGVGPRHGSR